MANKSKKFYITTSIAYTNAPPHIGFALESIQADVLARYHRFLSEEVFFLTGTDEHGVKIAKKAEEEGKEPKEFVDDLTARYKKLKGILNLSNDDFIRTTDQKRHWPSVEKVWLKLKENNDIYKKKYKGLYCAGCESFIKEKDLINGKCPVHQKAPQLIEEENYFFRLSKYGDRIKGAINKGEIKIIPESRKNETIEFINQGLEDVSFSRSKENLKWGIPVPGDPDQTIYVWCDALTNYISIFGYAENSPKFKKYWPADIHCVGKDIMRFHTILWPAMLFSIGLELPKIIFVHGFITVGNQKMSKSLGNVIDPFELVKKYDSASSPQVGTDAVRYFLLREIPPTDDGDFTYQKFDERYSADLAGGIGNLLARIITMAEKVKINTTKISPEFEKEIKKAKDSHKKFLDDFKFNEALKSIWELISFCDRYIDKEKPWETKNPQVIYNLLVCVSHIAQLLQSFLPETSEKIFQQLGVNLLDKKFLKFKIKKGESLFPKLKTL
jgi:methionyl-tRNA synthetase